MRKTNLTIVTAIFIALWFTGAGCDQIGNAPTQNVSIDNTQSINTQSASIQADNSVPPPAAGYGTLPYKLPTPGSYELPSIGKAPDGEVLDDEGHVRHLYDLYKNKIVLLSFIYSRCTDVNACPLANYSFYKIKAAMQHDPALAKSLKLITLSFDPTHDTPDVMRLFAANFDYAGPKGKWSFLTTASTTKLKTLLKAYDQSIQVNPNTISHLLRVFLIDQKKQIREIYSVGFLHPDILLTDVRTVMMNNKDEITK